MHHSRTAASFLAYLAMFATGTVLADDLREAYARAGALLPQNVPLHSSDLAMRPIWSESGDFFAYIGVAGVIGLALGHHPELQAAMYPEFFPKQVAKAKEAIAAGKGDEKTRFTAAQCCSLLSGWTTPRIYLSYFDPDGPGTMAGNAAKVKAGVPVLFVFGKRDVIFKLLEDAKQSYADYVPGRLPANPLHRRVILDADHGQVPGQSIRDVLQWLKDLP